MAKNLVIVESPAKAKTISRFLGKDYKVLASMGHVRDLPKSNMGIDIENDFKPNYSVSPDKKKIVSQLKAELTRAENLYIATDEDREGEAIGWHLVQILKPEKTNIPTFRIVFHEITEKAIKNAISSPKKIDEKLVDAQQARRVLDRLVGYELSPLLWKKIRFGLSAGRVQSVAVRLIVDREREIQNFKPEEYWRIIGNFEKQDKKLKDKDRKFSAELQKFNSKKFEVVNEEQAKKVLSDLDGANYLVTKVEKKTQKRSPSPPFITSTLQQEASRKLGFSVKKTMMVAQKLYEGVDLGSGATGLITYMRTDSVNLSDLALSDAKKVISQDFGSEYALSNPRRYKGRKGAQEAHEAIRPVDLTIRPEIVFSKLEKDLARLYELIWKRTIACQMAEAILDKVAVDVEARSYMFRATGQTVKFAGFMNVYMEGKDEENDDENASGAGEKFLPILEEKEEVDLEKLNNSQHFTKPPARYTEASLVKKLESEGIGRPSTYAPTISTIMTRGYIEKEGKALKPTDTGFVVTDMLVEHFSQIVDYHFTAQMEENLDLVEHGKVEWVPMLRDFYTPFHNLVSEKDKELKKSDVITETTDEICDKCGSSMTIKLGRFGKFLSCSNYPECKNAKPMKGSSGEGGASGLVSEENMTPEQKKQVEDYKKKFKDKKCDKCGELMDVKVGRFGPFLGCSKYPDCKNITPIIVFSGVKCPKCKEGQLVERRTRKAGKIFWGCNKFPKCYFASWDKPIRIDEKSGMLVVLKKNFEEGIYEPVAGRKAGGKKGGVEGKGAIKAKKVPLKKGTKSVATKKNVSKKSKVSRVKKEVEKDLGVKKAVKKKVVSKKKV